MLQMGHGSVSVAKHVSALVALHGLRRHGLPPWFCHGVLYFDMVCPRGSVMV